MKNVDETYGIERPIRHRQGAPIEQVNGNKRLRPDQYIKASHAHVRANRTGLGHDSTIAASYVQ